MDKLLDILNNGIKAKRQGDYKSALDCYSQAQKIDPLDSTSYGNSMKVLIGTGQYEQAFRHLLVLCNFNIVQDLFSQDLMAEGFYQQFLPRFNWASNELTDNHNYEPKLVYEGIKKNSALKELIYKAYNLTFYIGHCYVGEFKDKDGHILLKFGAYNKYFDNLNNAVLGQLSGQTFRDTPQEGYFLSIGFIYAHMNLNFALKTKQEIVNYYLNPKTEIRKDIWNYNQFLNLQR